jgi:hypothetical protein
LQIHLGGDDIHGFISLWSTAENASTEPSVLSLSTDAATDDGWRALGLGSPVGLPYLLQAYARYRFFFIRFFFRSLIILFRLKKSQDFALRLKMLVGGISDLWYV